MLPKLSLLRGHIFLLVVAAATVGAAASGGGIRQSSVVYKAGEIGYSCFRIPALKRLKSGALIAFAEARKSGCGDHGDVRVVSRTSTDNGKVIAPRYLLSLFVCCVALLIAVCFRFVCCVALLIAVCFRPFRHGVPSRR